MQKWEYKVIETECKGLVGGVLEVQYFNDSLNALGKEGWEVVSSVALNVTQGSTKKVITVLKREC